MTMAESGSTTDAAWGIDTSMPSMADSTEMAGVIAPSPNSRQAPPMPIRAMTDRMRGLTALRWARAISARMPPSPLLSARMTSSTYLTVTIRNSDQKDQGQAAEDFAVGGVVLGKQREDGLEGVERQRCRYRHRRRRARR